MFDPARSFEAPNEYLPALGALDFGPRFFLDRFAETVPVAAGARGRPPARAAAQACTRSGSTRRAGWRRCASAWAR